MEVYMFNLLPTFFSPGLFESVPGADRARVGLQPAAGPAVPSGDGDQSWQQGKGAARPVQHPHRRAWCQLMNCHRHLTRITCAPAYRWTDKGARATVFHVKLPHKWRCDNLWTLEFKKFIVFLLFFAPFTRLGVFSPFVRATCNPTSYVKKK